MEGKPKVLLEFLSDGETSIVMLSKTKHHLITGSRYSREQRTQRRSMARANGSTTRQHSCCSSQQTAAVPRNFIEGEEKSSKNSQNPPGMEICREDQSSKFIVIFISKIRILKSETYTRSVRSWTSYLECERV